MSQCQIQPGQFRSPVQKLLCSSIQQIYQILANFIKFLKFDLEGQGHL